MKFYITKHGHIYGRVLIQRKQVKYYIGEKINPRTWSHKSQKVLSANPRAVIINNLIAKIMATSMDIFTTAKIKGIPVTPQYFKSVMDTSVNGDHSHRLTLWQYADRWLSYSRSAATTKAYKSKTSFLRKMFPSLDWSDITPGWGVATHEKISATHSHNYSAKILSVFRTMLLAARYEGYMTSEIPSKLVPPSHKTNSIYLSVDDISLLYKTKQKHEYLTNAVLCWMALYSTGQRVSDLPQILKNTPIEVQGVRIIRIVQTKTNKNISIPFSPLLNDIRSRNPHVISDVKINEYIKNAARDTGLSSWPHITSHTARRSCATNLILAGMPIKSVMDITGHTTEREFMKYIRYDDLTGAIRTGQDMAFHALFNV